MFGLDRERVCRRRVGADFARQLMPHSARLGAVRKVSVNEASLVSRALMEHNDAKLSQSRRPGRWSALRASEPGTSRPSE